MPFDTHNLDLCSTCAPGRTESSLLDLTITDEHPYWANRQIRTWRDDGKARKLTQIIQFGSV
jgi:hypothetical protein